MSTNAAPEVTFGLLTDDDDRPVASCVRERIHPDLFFPTVPDNPASLVMLDVRAASACMSCPLAAECRTYAERSSATGCWGGVVLGVTGERRAFVVVTPDGDAVGVAEVEATSTQRWRETFSGRRGFARRGRVRVGVRCGSLVELPLRSAD